MDAPRQVMRRIMLGQVLVEQEQPDIKSQLAKLGLRRGDPVGKIVGPSTYVHRQYEKQVVPNDVLAKAKRVVEKAAPELSRNYTALKYDRKTGAVGFQHSPDFDEADEPIVGETVLVKPDGQIARTRQKQDPQIWHHKWMWVGDDYDGFDVEESMERSLAWTPKVKDKSRIGTKSYWDKLTQGWNESLTEAVLLELRNLTPDEVSSTVATCRTTHKGSRWGDASKAHEFLRSRFKPTKVGRLLDFGSGNPPTHGMKLRQAGYNVDFWDHGENHDPQVHVQAIKPIYDVVLASKVLNVQPTPDALHVTLDQIKHGMKPGSVFVGNYPEPHKVVRNGNALTPDDIEAELQKVFGSVERAEGGNSSPVWVCKAERGTQAEAVAASDVTLHKVGDEDTAQFYFEIGHGNDMYHVSEFDLEFTDPRTHEIWVLNNGQVERHQQVREDQVEFDLEDDEAMEKYFEVHGELPTWSHNMIWNYLDPPVDDHWKGHYEGDTGRLSVVKPGRFKLTNQLLGLLRSEFSPNEIHVFE